MLDIARIDIRVGSTNPRYLNVDLERREVGYLFLEGRGVITLSAHNRSEEYVLQAVRRVIAPVVMATLR